VENVPDRDQLPGRHEAVAAQAQALAMPDVSPDTLWRSPNLIPVTGQRYTLGWQDAKKDGPCFLLVRTSVMGDKILDRFPLTQNGWDRAWKALVKLDADAAQAVAKTLQESRATAARSEAASELDARTLIALPEVAYLGGYISEPTITPGKWYDVRFLEDRLAVFACRGADVLAEVPYGQIEHVEIGGPGLVKSGGGFVGGGFGVTGAIEGMAIAAILNGLTTRTSIRTVVRIQGTGCELFLLYTGATPDQLRIGMSRTLSIIRSALATEVAERTQQGVRAVPSSPVEELAKLADMLEKGLLTREEFDLLKAKLIGRPTSDP
jgi:hypothetical protein